MAKFKVGDLVRLKPKNSPEMAVDSIHDGYVWATWFSSKKLEKGRFAVETLIPADDEEEKK